MKLNWITESRKIKDLIPLEKNPFGKITTEKKRRLKEKLTSLGVFEIATIDTDNILLTFNKRHAALMELGRGEESIDVRVPNRPLTESERKEIILNSNIHEGSWIEEILKEEFGEVDLSALGLEIEIEEPKPIDLENENNDEPEFPIVQKFSEKYTAIIIVCTNDIDETHVSEILNLDKEKCYKKNDVGNTRVISAEKFISLWKASKS
jgi:hypothetical protein